VMPQPVQQGCGELGIPKDLYPFAEGQISGDYVEYGRFV
jgi:hypothetical protein